MNKQINKQTVVSLGYCISLGAGAGSGTGQIQRGNTGMLDRSGCGGKSRLGSQKMAFPGASDRKVNGFMRRQRHITANTSEQTNDLIVISRNAVVGAARH